MMRAKEIDRVCFDTLDEIMCDRDAIVALILSAEHALNEIEAFTIPSGVWANEHLCSAARHAKQLLFIADDLLIAVKPKLLKAQKAI